MKYEQTKTKQQQTNKTKNNDLLGSPLASQPNCYDSKTNKQLKKQWQKQQQTKKQQQLLGLSSQPNCYEKQFNK